MDERKPTERFTDRVEEYVKYRPGYPREVIWYLESQAGLIREDVIADIGSGTGILSELFLLHGNQVYGIEPNAKMREAAERLLARYPGFVSRDGAAERTGLADQSVDFITAGQAFHWFEPVATRAEFARVLKRRGCVVLIWNERKESSALAVEYEGILEKYGIDYEAVSAKYRGGEEPVREFFTGGELRIQTFPNAQTLDEEGFRGRLLSASYAPRPGHPSYDPMIGALKETFRRYSVDGRIEIPYDTRVYLGRF